LCLNTSRRRHRRSNRKATVLNKSASTESSLIGDLLTQHRAALLQSLTRHACIIRALCKYEYLYNRKGNVYEYVRSMTARHSGDRNASPCRRKLCQELSLDIVFPIACIPRTDPAVGEEIDAELRVSRVWSMEWSLISMTDRPMTSNGHLPRTAATRSKGVDPSRRLRERTNSRSNEIPR